MFKICFRYLIFLENINIGHLKISRDYFWPQKFSESSDMTWNFHMNEVSKKIYRNIGILKKLQLIVPNNIRLIIYNTLISPHINNCLLSLGSKPDKIFQLQKRAVRAISGANSKSHTVPLFKFYNILKVDAIFTYKLLTFY